MRPASRRRRSESVFRARGRPATDPSVPVRISNKKSKKKKGKERKKKKKTRARIFVSTAVENYGVGAAAAV